MPHITQHISNRLFRLWLAVMLLCCLPVTDFRAQAQTDMHGESLKKECLTKHDGLGRHIMQERQMPLAGTVISAKTGQRVGSSRPVRLHPSNGGKPVRSLVHWTDGDSIQHSKHLAQLLHRMDCGLRTRAASPRFYYVLALRRLLC